MIDPESLPTEQRYHEVEEALVISLEAGDPNRVFHGQKSGSALHWWIDGSLDEVAAILAEQGWTPPPGMP